MILGVLNSSNWAAVLGTPDAPLNPLLDIIAQQPDCSAFLVLAKEAIPALAPFEGYEGYDFTYCQEWGLTINDDVVKRVVRDLRAKAYPPKEDYLDAIVKGDQEALGAYVAACHEVKARYPK